MTSETEEPSDRARRVGGRSHRVVCDVLRAVTSELSRVGYAGLRVEDVAASANVNKTTVYRRWPTKAALVVAALQELTEPDAIPPDTGSLAADLRLLLDDLVACASSPEGRTMARVLAAEVENSEVEAMARGIRAARLKLWIEVVERAGRRGEIPAGSDGRLMAEMIMSASITRIRRHEPLDDSFLGASIGLVVAGARAGGAVRSGEDVLPAVER